MLEGVNYGNQEFVHELSAALPSLYYWLFSSDIFG